jgi:hypothetical protein
VQPLHLSLLFDGTDLFVAAVSPTVYVSLNGQAVAANQWIPVGISSEICFGSAVLHVARGESQPPPASPSQFPNAAQFPATAIFPAPIPAAETGPEATLSDGGRLRQLAQQARENAGMQPSAPPPAVSPPAAPGPAVLPTPVPAAGNPAAPAPSPNAGQSAPPAPAKAKGSSWSETSLVKKLTLFLLPLAAAGTWLTWDEPEPEPTRRKAKRQTPAASASVLSAGPSARATNPAPSGAVAPANKAPASTGSASNSGATVRSAAPASSAAPIAVAPPSGVETDDPKAAASTDVMMLAPTSSDTTPRAAIDAAFAGRLEKAKELYAKLAAAYPDKPAFALAKQRVEENAVRKP